MSTTASNNAYDDLIYPSLSFPQTHPDLLGTLATLFGLQPAPTDRCRVLELGSASGANIIPLAYAWPDSQFVGIDYSAKQIEEATRRLERVKLPNLQLRHASILDIDESWGKFDYIICHGVYSWVPAEVQDGILRVCKQNLAEHGIGYISYNVLPGWHMRGMIREMMCYHDTWHLKSPPLERVKQARALLQFLGNACKNQNTPYGLLLKQELEVLSKVADGYIFHEHLEEHNDPIYFFEFHERLTKHDLRFLGEADFRMMVHENLPAEVREGLAKVAPNLIQMEQYLDFLSNRMFRQSLVCHEAHRPTYNLTPERIMSFQVASALKAATKPIDLSPGVQVTFTQTGGVTIATPEPIVKAGLAVLGEAWPVAMPFEVFFKKARERLPNASLEESAIERDRMELAGTLLKLYSIGGTSLVEFWRSYPKFVTRVNDRPIASPVARMMAEENQTVATLRHQCLILNDIDRKLLPLLDGTQSRTTLRMALMQAFTRGQFNLARKGQPIKEEHQARPILTEMIDQQLERYAETGLLVG
jgi:methyltransferase-like protein